jgi:hypothetical protein
MQKIRTWYFLWSRNTETTTNRMVNTFKEVNEKLVEEYSENKSFQWDGNPEEILKISGFIEKSVLPSYPPQRQFLRYQPNFASFSSTPLAGFISQGDIPRLDRLLLDIQSGRLKDDGIVVNLPLNALAIAMALGNRWGKKVCFEKLEDGTRVYVENQTETASSRAEIALQTPHHDWDGTPIEAETLDAARGIFTSKEVGAKKYENVAEELDDWARQMTNYPLTSIDRDSIRRAIESHNERSGMSASNVALSEFGIIAFKLLLEKNGKAISGVSKLGDGTFTIMVRENSQAPA